MSHRESGNPPTDLPTHLDHPVAYEDSVVEDVALGESSTAEKTATDQATAGAELPPAITSAEIPQGTLVDRIRQRREGER
jgi:hypothetical protein